MTDEKQCGAPTVRQRVRRIYTFNEAQFSGVYKGCKINIDRVPGIPGDPFCHRFSITVRAQDGGYLYDGWWSSQSRRPMTDAVMEALHGAGLLQRAAEEASDG